MKILLAQIEIQKNYKQNFETILKIIKTNQFDILVFPELALTGYDLKKVSKIPDKKIQKSLAKIQKEINKKQKVVIGTKITENSLIYNSAAIISKKSIKYYHKNTLTDYDTLYFNAGDSTFIFKQENEKIGLLICRDQNNLSLIDKYKTAKCTILLQLSAHYYKPKEAIQKLDKNIAMPIVRAIDSNTLFCKVNTVGKKKKQISLGSSMIVNAKGYVHRKANILQEELIHFNTKEEKCK